MLYLCKSILILKVKIMLNSKKMEDSQNIGVVYDVSLEGTLVNALGANVISNTDG